jgi:hypothetical protein
MHSPIETRLTTRRDLLIMAFLPAEAIELAVLAPSLAAD